MKTYFLNVIKNHYVDFKGRATRKQFWLFALWSFIFAVALAFLSGLFQNSIIGTVFTALYYVYNIALILPSLAIAARRLHDINFSGWWLLLMLVPVANCALLVAYVWPSREPNRF